MMEVRKAIVFAVLIVFVVGPAWAGGGREDEPAQPASTETEVDLIGEYEGPEVVTDVNRFPTDFNEAPMLSQMVAAGDLPPVDERLPVFEDVLVLEPSGEIGRYGGTWRRGFTGPGDWVNGLRIASNDRFLAWHPVRFPEMVPNVARDVEVSDDGTTFTIVMRRGLRWSDGELFTADDVMFWFEHMYNNDELTPVPNPIMSIDGQEATVTRLDDYRVQVRFAAPNTLFREVFGSSVNVFGGQWHFGRFGNGGYAPEHYLRQFHPAFVDQAELDAIVAREGFDTWTALFRARNQASDNPDLPVLSPWMVEVPPGAEGWVLVRNPYYFGVDSAGNQLPYIDRISFAVAEDLEVLNLRAVAGEYDFQARHLTMANIPLFLENAEQGDYTLYLDPGQHGTDAGFHFNLSYRGDAEITRWFQNRDFRRALSLAIDRDQINEIFFLGLGTPGSPVVAETGIHTPGPEYRDLWATFDPERANRMLDEIGLTERDADGYRLRTDNGERLIIEVTTIPAFLPNTQIAEMVREQWADVGIFTNIVEQERSLWFGRLQNNEIQITVWQNDGSDELFLFGHHVLPISTESAMGPAYGLWFRTGGAQGIEPTDPALVEALDLFRRAPGMTVEDRIDAGRRIWEIAIDEVWTIGTVGQSGAFMGVRVAKNNMGNVPSRHFNIQAGLTPSISRPQMFFFRDAE